MDQAQLPVKRRVPGSVVVNESSRPIRQVLTAFCREDSQFFAEPPFETLGGSTFFSSYAFRRRVPSRAPLILNLKAVFEQ